MTLSSVVRRAGLVIVAAARPRATSRAARSSNPWFHVARDDPDTVSAPTLAAVGRAIAEALTGVERH